MAVQFLFFILGLCISGTFAHVKEIYRPCRLNDLKCIGDNFEANSECKLPVKGRFPDPYYHGKPFHFETPFFNASYVNNNIVVRNLNLCHITEFFFNTRTDKAVLTIDCPFFDVESDRTYIQHATAKEDMEFQFHIRSTYPLLRITLNFKKDMNLCNASVYTDVTQLPRIHIDPKNPPTAKQLSKDLSFLYIYEREACHYRGPTIAKLFFQYMLCDYQCNV